MAAALLGASLLTGCSGGGGDVTYVTKGGEKLTQAQYEAQTTDARNQDAPSNIVQIDAKNGSTIIYRVEMDSGTDYEWIEQVDPAFLQTETKDESKPDGDGGKIVYTYKFKALKAGETNLELAFRKAGDASVANESQLSVKVVIS
ncbi:MAG: protease inhibitor I42 family protein [Propionibacteriaceae bacterium]|nr:protease inhibitor I42 family protein [Propionibacteriaceae bacterium]